jgi:hypothetical protein
MDIDHDALLRLVSTIDAEWTDGLCQNSDVMSNSRQGKHAASEALLLLGKEHPAYPLVFTSWGCHANTLKAEEGEDLRQKGISGIWERHKAALITVIKAHRAGKEHPTQ